MSRQLVATCFGIFLAGFFITVPILAQNITDPESEYQRIRTIAFDGDYASAASASRKLVNEFPSYGDARILLGRILAWQKDYKNAAAVIDTLLMTDPANADALSAKKDISLWSRVNSPVLTDIRAGYYFDTFNEPYSRYWQIFHAGAGHKFSWGQASAGINAGNLIIGKPSPSSETQLQFEIDAYPRLSSKNYAYISYAFSPGSYFPSHRAALEVWQVLPSGWAVSGGLNYYYFNRNIFIALASVEKYVGKYWFSLKAFVYFKDEGPTTSFYFNARRYFNDKDFLQITLGTGTAPDEPFDIQSSLMRFSANSVRLSYNVSVTSRLMMRLNAGYSREEYSEAIWRNRFEGGINFIYAIKMK
jgi:YaiO family outer membrane protein